MGLVVPVTNQEHGHSDRLIHYVSWYMDIPATAIIAIGAFALLRYGLTTAGLGLGALFLGVGIPTLVSDISQLHPKRQTALVFAAVVTKKTDPLSHKMGLLNGSPTNQGMSASDVLVALSAKWPPTQPTPTSKVARSGGTKPAAIALASESELLANLKGCEQAIRRDPNIPGHYANKGILLTMLKRPEEALPEFDTVIEMEPKVAGHHNNKGIALSRLGRDDEAIIEYDKAIALIPPDKNDGDPHMNKGVTLLRKGKLDEALEEIGEALLLNPQDANTHSSMGNVLLAIGKITEAIEHYTEAIRLKSDNPTYYSNRGLAFEQIERFAEALKDFNKLVEMDPNDSEYHNDKGICLAQLGRKGEALREFAEAIKIEPRVGKYHYNKGNILMELNRYGEAVSEFDIAIQCKVHPISLAWFHENKGIALLQMGKVRSASIEFARAAKADPSAKLYYNIGSMLLSHGRFRWVARLALYYFDKAAKLENNVSTYHENKGITLAILGKFEDAIRSLDKALELEPDNLQYRKNRDFALAETEKTTEEVYLDSPLATFLHQLPPYLHLEVTPPPPVIGGPRVPAHADHGPARRSGEPRVLQLRREHTLRLRVVHGAIRRNEPLGVELLCALVRLDERNRPLHLVQVHGPRLGPHGPGRASWRSMHGGPDNRRLDARWGRPPGAVEDLDSSHRDFQAPGSHSTYRPSACSIVGKTGSVSSCK